MKKRIVVKVGSNVLTTDKGKLDITRMSALVDQIAWLRERDYDVVLVTSGAVACGRKELQVDHQLDSVEQRQLFSAMGQVKLINLYYDLFREYNIHIGQVLTTKENFQSDRSYQNQRACVEVMLEN
ncbi:MAG: glutamate 5-kinase, partial [Bacteroidaceae bacterium]|nr:glutamate 5-kinase [Bacteroidaceae bacterium]